MSKRKHNERNAGRKPLPDGTAKRRGPAVLLRDHERTALETFAADHERSASGLLRDGLRVIGVPLDKD